MGNENLLWAFEKKMKRKRPRETYGPRSKIRGLRKKKGYVSVTRKDTIEQAAMVRGRIKGRRGLGRAPRGKPEETPRTRTRFK